MIVILVISSLTVFLLIGAVQKIRRSPRAERRYEAPIILWESLTYILLVAGSCLLFPSEQAWWQTVCYSIAAVLAGLAVLCATASLAERWRRRLRLAGKLAVPAGKQMVPQGHVLVRYREHSASSSASSHQVVSALSEGELYLVTERGFFTYSHSLAPGEEFSFRGQRTGRSGASIRWRIVSNSGGQAKFRLAHRDIWN